MLYNAAVRTAVLAFAFAIVGAASEKLAHGSPPCTKGRVEVDNDKRTLIVSLDNHCDARIPCKVTWRLRCNRGPAQEKEEAVQLEAHGDQRIEATASMCSSDGDWEISPPRWRCDEPVEISERPSGKRPRRR